MISKKIKALREHNNYTQDDLALACNVSRSAISNYENNRRQPNPEVVKTIACVFGVTIEELLNNDISIEQILNGPEPSMSFDTNIDDDHVVVGNKRFASVVQVLNAVTTLIVTICLLMVLIPAIKDNKFYHFQEDVSNIETVTLQLSNINETVEYEMKECKNLNDFPYKQHYRATIDAKPLFDNSDDYFYISEINVNIILNGKARLKKIALINNPNNSINFDSFYNLKIKCSNSYLFIFYYKNNYSYIGAFVAE